MSDLLYKRAPAALSSLGAILGVGGYIVARFLEILGIRIGWPAWAGIGIFLALLGWYHGKLLRTLYINSIIDPLTGLYNRRHFYARMNEELLRKSRTKAQLSVAMIDVDEFKKVNDRFGHAAGDRLLCDLARIFKENFRASDIIARWGGDEFAIIFPDTRLEDAVSAAERVRLAVRDTFHNEEVTVSAGVVFVPDEIGINELLNIVDKALYQAKNTKDNVMIIAISQQP